MTMLETGAKAPDFKLKSHDGEDVTLDQYRGKWVVLHTFPLAFTGG
ncbi:MAG: redoxin domain-containing protein [Gammaproteobacteria bacterium]|nr:redoxin domain-containing protein [Gammaproteobacteria bacterium]